MASQRPALPLRGIHGATSRPRHQNHPSRTHQQRPAPKKQPLTPTPPAPPAPSACSPVVSPEASPACPVGVQAYRRAGLALCYGGPCLGSRGCAARRGISSRPAYTHHEQQTTRRRRSENPVLQPGVQPTTLTTAEFTERGKQRQDSTEKPTTPRDATLRSDSAAGRCEVARAFNHAG